MTKHFKANEDVEIDGTAHAAGSFFSRGDEPSDEVDAAIADGKIVNVAAEDVPQTITESEAADAEANAISREEATAQGIDVDKVEAEAETVEVVPDPKDEDAGSDSSSENEPAVASEAPAEDVETTQDTEATAAEGEQAEG